MEINRHNYEEYLMLLLDDELKPAEKIQLEAYMLLNEDVANEWKSLQKTKLKVNSAPAYPRMAMLLKDEEVETAVMAKIPAATVVSLPNSNKFFTNKLMYWSAAASIAAIVTLFALLNFNKTNTNNIALQSETEKTSAQNKTHISNTEKMPLAGENLHISDVEKIASANPETNIVVIKNKPQNKAFLKNAIYAENAEIIESKSPENLALVEMKINEVENSENSNYRLQKKINRQIAANMKVDWSKYKPETEIALQDDSDGLIPSLINFFSDNLHIERKTVNQEKFYAVTLETQNVHISRTFKSNF